MAFFQMFNLYFHYWILDSWSIRDVDGFWLLVSRTASPSNASRTGCSGTVSPDVHPSHHSDIASHVSTRHLKDSKAAHTSQL